MSSTPQAPKRAQRAWVMLTLLLGLESASGVIALVPLTQAFFHQGNDLLTHKISIFVAALLALIWVLITFIGAARHRASWSRGSAITLHVLMFAAGTGVLQYALAPGYVGWALVLVALVGFFTAMLARPEESAHGTDGDVPGDQASSRSR